MSLTSSVDLPNKPNIILLLADDMGWDMASFGHPTQEWNPIDDMAREGTRFTNWYAPDSICSPSRAATMTGRLAGRIGLWSNSSTHARVFSEVSSNGLPQWEYTIAEALSDVGYATGMVGKWHLGINEFNSSDGNHLPHNHGFQYVGLNLPFSNEWYCEEIFQHMPDGPSPSKCFLYEGSEIIQQPIAHENLTQRLTSQAMDFIRNNKEKPFFFYMSYIHMHASLFVSPEFRGMSSRGYYGDGIMELAWSVGQIISMLKNSGLDKNTMVIFTSDNGPQVLLCEEGGSPGMFTGGKSLYWEGGIRVPTVIWWPGYVAAGLISSQLATSMDIYPTALDLAGAQIPTDRVIDGRSLRGTLFEDEKSPHRFVFFYCTHYLFAARHNNFKLILRGHAVKLLHEIADQCPEGIPVNITGPLGCTGEGVYEYDPPMLFDLQRDPAELYSLPLETYDDVYQYMYAAALEHQRNFIPGEPLLDSNDENCDLRPCCDPPHCVCNYPGHSFELIECND